MVSNYYIRSYDCTWGYTNTTCWIPTPRPERAKGWFFKWLEGLIETTFGERMKRKKLEPLLNFEATSVGRGRPICPIPILQYCWSGLRWRSLTFGCGHQT